MAETIIAVILAVGVTIAFCKFFNRKSKETPTGGVGITPDINHGDDNKPS